MMQIFILIKKTQYHLWKRRLQFYLLSDKYRYLEHIHDPQSFCQNTMRRYFHV